MKEAAAFFDLKVSAIFSKGTRAGRGLRVTWKVRSQNTRDPGFCYLRRVGVAMDGRKCPSGQK